jgi:hypothetical protein
LDGLDAFFKLPPYATRARVGGLFGNRGQTRPTRPETALYAGGGGALSGLPFSALAASFPREVVRHVLNTEVASGRMIEEYGVYAIAPGAFDRETLLALAALGPVEPELHDARARDLGAARSDETPENKQRASVASEGGRRAESAA